MGKYTCPKEGCNFVKELFYHDGEGIRAILDHEKTHVKNTKEIEKIEKIPCEKCDGKGYTEHMYIVDQDVSKTD